MNGQPQIVTGAAGAVARPFETVDIESGVAMGLVNHPAMLEAQMRLNELDAAWLHRLFATNAVGAVLSSREAVRRMSTCYVGSGAVILDVAGGR